MVLKSTLTIFSETENLAESVHPFVHLDLSGCSQVVGPQMAFVHRPKTENVLKELGIQIRQDLLAI